MKKVWITVLLFAVLLAVYFQSAVKVQSFREGLDPTQTVSALMVKPEALEIVGGEFRGILADYLLLKASTFLGSRYNTKESDLKAVSVLFGQSLALDPYFFQTCYFIQAFLPWGSRMVKEAIELLEISKNHRYWDWEPPYYIGFDYFYFLHDNLAASRYLMEASERPHAPPLLAMLGARLSQRAGQTRAAIVFLQTMAKREEREVVRKQILKRIDALKGVLVLEKAIAAFESRFGHPPETLGELVDSGILEKIPKNPYKSADSYSYENGEIGF